MSDEWVGSTAPWDPEPPWEAPRESACSAPESWHVLGVLEELGDTPEEIRESLGRMAIRGSAGSPRDCALARFLGRRFGEAFGVGGSLSVSRAVRWPGASCELPHPCNEFVRKFDAEGYPELLDEHQSPISHELRAWIEARDRESPPDDGDAYGPSQLA